MSESVSQAEIDAAIAYEELFIPALFGQWPTRILEAARVGSGHRVLDVACGTGILGRAAARLTGPDGSVAGVDPNAGMLRVAGRFAPEIEWRHGAAESLPFPDASFDAVVSQFGMMFFDDRALAIREMMRVLVAGGYLVIAVWDALESSPGYATEVELLERTVGPHAAEALRAPFVLGDRETLAMTLAEAGVSPFEIENHPGTARFPSIRAMVEADLRGWLPVMGVILTEKEIDHVLLEAEEALRPYLKEDGRVEFAAPALMACTRKGR
jgi:SAM-dependent methyltransferase